MVLAVALLMLLPILASMATLAAADPLGPGTYFEYVYEQEVKGGTGAYAGYTESTDGEGRYEVLTWGPDEARVKYRWSWNYKNSEYDRESSRDSGIISFNISTRLYTSSHIDLDDPIYAIEPPGTLGQWLWVPPDVKKGDKLWILTEEWTVTDTDATLWVRLVPRKLIEVTAEGTWSRNDDYGQFAYDYVDRLYFDKGTGMFFAERYEEHDSGSWEGQRASFDYYIDVDVTEASYVPAIDWPELVKVYTFWTLVTLGIVGFIGYVAYRIRWRGRSLSADVETEARGVKTTKSVYVRVKRVKSMKDVTHLKNRATDHFDPFLNHMVDKTLLAKDRVAIASDSLNNLVGIAFYNKEAKVGTIFCKGSEVTETLRAYLKFKDFFSETKHHIKVKPAWRLTGTQERNIKRYNNEAYNVFETHKVYRLEGIPQMSYDPSLVRPMERDDLNGVIKLAKKLYRTRAKRWITACLDSGDLGYVAEMDGFIVGFGFACVCGEHGRLHTLGVSKEHRGRGIAKELHRARLEAMRRMGVATVIDEIADWNLASIRISTLSGFEPVGRMWVETVRTKRIKKNIVRR